jgi:DNA repair exonuclease SbcCD ATPase subunit
MKVLFDYIKKEFKWCLIVSHIDGIKQYFDTVIQIDKNNGKSFISVK